jgi:8-oxo-dGTP pyrophosphatase MutT (NUDIX family)
MNILGIYNDNETEPVGYTERPTVKAVIVNDDDEVLLFGGGLPGGGVDDGETNEQALDRELMEEIGATVSVTRPIGNVITYRDLIQKKYMFTGYLCTIVSIGTPTTTFGYELEHSTEWVKRDVLIERFKQHMKTVKEKGMTEYVGDRYQRHLSNTYAAILFLEAVEK